MEEKIKETQLKEDEAKKVSGGAINPISGGILGNGGVTYNTAANHAKVGGLGSDGIYIPTDPMGVAGPIEVLPDGPTNPGDNAAPKGWE